MIGEASTIPAWLLRNFASCGDAPALLAACQGTFESISWRQLGQDVGRLCVVLERLGLQSGDRVVQIAENSHPWVITDLAVLTAGLVHVPLHASLAAGQLANQIVDSGARLAIVADVQMGEQINKHLSASPSVQFITHDEILSRCTSDVSDRHAENALAKAAAIASDQLATIMYTSGTSGLAKGVMLSHGNLASNAAATANRFEREPDELRLCFLPLTHIYARTCDMYTWIYNSSQMALAQNRETILADCAAVAPTLINGVPYFYEKVYRRLHASGKANEPGVLKRLFGNRIEVCFSGGAALGEHLENYFAEQGLPLLQGYGLTESSPVISASNPTMCRRGCVGKPLDGVEVRVAADGEILTRGPHVMLGYWNDGEATKNAIRDGWLHTGDLGELDRDGFLRITGRKKEMIVTSTGKNIAPALLEGLLVGSPYILQAMVVGDDRSHLAALIVPEPERLREFIRANRLWVFSRRMAVRHRRVRQLYREEIDRMLSTLSRHEQIGPFTVLDRGFTIESGELTPKASLRRNAILRNLSKVIEKMYAD